MKYAECQNCKWQGSAEECNAIENLMERVAPGEPMPIGECPKCGALCQPMNEVKDVQPTIHEKLYAIAGYYYSHIMDAWGVWPGSYQEARTERGKDELAQFLAIEFAEVMDGWNTWDEARDAITGALDTIIGDLQSLQNSIAESTEKEADELYQCRSCLHVCTEHELEGEGTDDRGVCPRCAMTSYRIGRELEED